MANNSEKKAEVNLPDLPETNPALVKQRSSKAKGAICKKYEPEYSLASDLTVLRHMWFAKVVGGTQQEQLESFYKEQAALYDSYRFRMLHGRPLMMQHVVSQLTRPTSDGKGGRVWLDMGGGTGSNVEYLPDSLHPSSSSSSSSSSSGGGAGQVILLDLVPPDSLHPSSSSSSSSSSSGGGAGLSKVILLDLCPSLAKQAEERFERKGWGPDVSQVVVGDACDPGVQGLPPDGSVDLITFSYAIVMIPDWRAALQNAKRMLKPGGYICVCDFTVDQSQWTGMGWLWKTIFKTDHVYLSEEHRPYLAENFEKVYESVGYGTFPYVPSIMRCPYFVFIGKKPADI
eukprot:CAMPEP_0113952618 /NCGR_PEP_ID=MMETSP1339-20121228/90526_1 /TAXON_ID=94617 /ORGANISM="Fibrocapsa japonica" /LENGTH=342 /DNA_ID=CAMNT_0000961265 /DNA_START=27 /DNA_END=1056 /DNA_ORIENTATION=+ /assembly_acc=CAM_ASM_000762